MMMQRWAIGVSVLLVSASIAMATVPPPARIGYTTGDPEYHVFGSGGNPWVQVGSGTPGEAENADYYYVRYVVVLEGGNKVLREYWVALAYDLGGDEWKLEVTNLHPTKDLIRVAFPFEATDTPLSPGDTSLGDNIAMSAYKAGMAMQVQDYTGGGLLFQHVPYPGSCFAPLALVSDDDYARIAFASNYPPRTVFPNARWNGLILEYQDLEIGYQESDEFYAIIRTVSGDYDGGSPPWYLAALQYRNWLQAKMTSEGLYPVSYNDWMIKNQGFLNIQLENITTYNLGNGAVYNSWYGVRDDLSWVLMWGQMSAHGGGCCDRIRDLHSRYTAADSFGSGVDIYDFVDDVANYGHHVGFYSRSLDYPNTLTSTNQEWWAQWLDNQDTWGANSNYFDVLGAGYHGPVLDIAHLFDEAWNPSGGTSALGFDIDTNNDGTDALIEGVQDFYPAAFLLSGFLGVDYDEYTDSQNQYHPPVETGGPAFNIDNLRDTQSGFTNKIHFPRLANVILNDRLFYIGESNGGGTLVGDWNYRNTDSPPDTSRNYWTERNAFLLGHKFDVIHMTLRDYSTENPRLRDILDLRDDHYWWYREMEYHDTHGITNVDSRLRVRRFSDLNAAPTFVVEWWDFDPNNVPSPLPTFTYESVTYDAPEAQLGIVETAWNYDDTSPCDSDSDGIPNYAEKSYCMYDLYPDGVINATDLYFFDFFLGSCTPSGTYVPNYDYDCDGCNDADDRQLIYDALGKTCE